MEQKIIQSKVDTFFLEEICPICNSGKISKSPNSKVYLTDPPQLDVMCNNNDCEYVSKRFEKELYPQIRYEYISEEMEESKSKEVKDKYDVIQKKLYDVTLVDAITIISSGYPLFFETNTKSWYLETELNLDEKAVTLKNKRKDFHFTFYEDKISIYEENSKNEDLFNNILDTLTDVHHVCYIQAYLCGYYVKAINKMIYNERD